MERLLENNVIFAKGKKLPQDLSANFTGQCWLNMLIPADSELNCPIGNVTFEPGCHNNWHKHPGGQILLVTEGRGWYQQAGQPARELHAGDVVEIPRQVKHWHGAAKDSCLVHLSIETDSSAGPAEWLEPVSEKEYNSLK